MDYITALFIHIYEYIYVYNIILIAQESTSELCEYLMYRYK
jgi:hypothetical protein